MRIGLTLALLLAAAPVAAHEQEQSQAEIKVERVAPGVAVLIGEGGNVGLSYGPDGNVLIDDQYAPLTDEIIAAVNSVNPGAVKFVINTHWHADHTGGNEKLGKRGAVIVAHDNVRERLSTEQFMERFGKIPASPPEALPVITFDEGLTFHLNGDTLQVVHAAHGHTDGDAVIRWQDANAIHMGDLFFHEFSLPFIDTDSGGSLAGLIAGVDAAIAMINENTVVIPGHGPVATYADLVAYRAMVADIRDKVAAGIAAGRSLEQIQASKPAAPYGMENGFIKPDEFVATLFEELNER